MTYDELKAALQERFDSGEDLTPDLRQEMQRHPGAAAYWQRLQDLESSLWRLPLETPSSDLVERLQYGVARDRDLRVWRQAAAFTLLASMALASVAIGWRYPEYATPQSWSYAISESFPEQEWLEHTMPLEEQLVTLWASFQSSSQPFALSLPVTFGVAAAGLLILVIFNATGARALRIAEGGSIAPDHRGKGV